MFESASKTFFHLKMLHCVAFDTYVSAVLHLAHLHGIQDSLTHIALQRYCCQHIQYLKEKPCSMLFYGVLCPMPIRSLVLNILRGQMYGSVRPDQTIWGENGSLMFNVVNNGRAEDLICTDEALFGDNILWGFCFGHCIFGKYGLGTDLHPCYICNQKWSS